MREEAEVAEEEIETEEIEATGVIETAKKEVTEVIVKREAIEKIGLTEVAEAVEEIGEGILATTKARETMTIKTVETQAQTNMATRTLRARDVKKEEVTGQEEDIRVEEAIETTDLQGKTTSGIRK